MTKYQSDKSIHSHIRSRRHIYNTKQGQRQRQSQNRVSLFIYLYFIGLLDGCGSTTKIPNYALFALPVSASTLNFRVRRICTFNSMEPKNKAKQTKQKINKTNPQTHSSIECKAFAANILWMNFYYTIGMGVRVRRMDNIT